MAYCTNCGSPVEDNAKFCGNCGKALHSGNSNSRKTVYEGEIHKCPHCGEVLSSFEAICPTCGYEIRGKKATESVRDFALKMEQIGNGGEENTNKRKKLFSKLRNIGGNANESRINLIRSFAVPNTKEDILEFMILASSNINFKLYGLGNQGVLTFSQRELSDAWLAKMEQTYEKAKFVFKDDDDFKKIEEIYTKTLKKLKWKRLEVPLVIAAPIVMMLAIIIAVLLIPEPSIESKIKERELQLENIIDDIEQDIASGEFKDARNKAYTLTFDADLSEEESEKWEEKQQEMLDIIEKAEEAQKFEFPW